MVDMAVTEDMAAMVDTEDMVEDMVAMEVAMEVAMVR